MYSSALGPESTFELLCRVNRVPALLATDGRVKALAVIDDVLPKLARRLPVDAAVVKRLEQIRLALRADRTSIPVSARRAVFFE